jgi:hypothetical protein
MRDITGWVLLCTTNDPESLTIVRIAQSLGIPLLQSGQMHGATLSREPSLFERVKEMGEMKDLAIVEIPGPHEEQKLQEQGIRIHIIDHHTYPELDRMQEEASLTQFLRLFEITDDDLKSASFDPEIIRGVALIDQGFLWELAASNLPEEKKRAARAYYLSRKREINPRYEEMEEEARRAWATAQMHDGILVIRSQSKHHLREALSFFIADAYQVDPPVNIIVEGDGRVSVQETLQAEKLFKKFGGFLFGKKMCWGMLAKDRPPTVDEIIANLCE